MDTPKISRDVVKVSPADVRGWRNGREYWVPGTPEPACDLYGVVREKFYGGEVVAHLVRHVGGAVEFLRADWIDERGRNTGPYTGRVVLL